MSDTALLARMIETGRARCERSAGQLVVKPTSSDLFGDTTGLPEINACELNPQTLAAGILHHGALLVRQLYKGDHLARLQRLSTTQEDANRQDNAPLGCSPATFSELLDIYRECGLLAVMEGYLDGEPVMFAERTKLRHHRAGRDKYAAIPWHQDVNFFGSKSYAVNCWAAVTSCGEDNPGLSIIPSRVDERVGWNGADGVAPLDYGRSLPPGALERFTDKHPAAHPVLQAGDALLFDEMTMHQTALKRWIVGEQIVTISWFFRPSGFPSWGTPLAL